MIPRLGLKESSRRLVLQKLDRALSDLSVLSVKTRNFHWNVVGPRFTELHVFFGSRYEALDTAIDETAERSRALGGRSLGSMAEFLRAAKLTENVGRALKEDAMLEQLLRDHESMIAFLRAAVDDCSSCGDQGTADFFTGMLQDFEKAAWMLRSYLS